MAEGRLDIFLNPQANRGAAAAAWPRLAEALRAAGRPFKLWTTTGAADVPARVAEAIGQGATCLVAAGGDGMLQLVLDALMAAQDQGLAPGTVHLGAIGLGTSNDFHKPIGEAPQLAGVPCRLALETARRRDVIRLDATLPSGEAVVHHLLQASHVGTIPAANHRLTRQRSLANWLYRYWYTGALLLASAQEVLTYRGFRAQVEAGPHRWEGEFTGMSLLKQRFVAGSFTFLTPRTPYDGRLDLALCRKVSVWRLLQLIDAFEKQGLRGHPEVHCVEVDEVAARFEQPLPIDYDGELLDVTAARWRVLPATVSILG
ncbi:MAG: Transcription regulator [contains diacylglycerol kinase catalytic domain] [Candidatus Ozemobacter sibiricus]|uniref:Transcription regulator [contains diacylglycerol kinase catalytic domain] n=1 Tax=Candidatus Ozemobacter sibiricus TaxID=2268124 RepID=A0A367ZLU4_9BACT|nr:MAG: Transcription regulator [contains diacylglycerol kinase catalytic domain] [Candidatus Ozemobacter sibiricus]